MAGGAGVVVCSGGGGGSAHVDGMSAGGKEGQDAGGSAVAVGGGEPADEAGVVGEAVFDPTGAVRDVLLALGAVVGVGGW